MVLLHNKTILLAQLIDIPFRLFDFSGGQPSTQYMRYGINLGPQENSTGIDGFDSTPVASPRRGRRFFPRLAAVTSFEGDTAYELAADQVSTRNDTVN